MSQLGERRLRRSVLVSGSLILIVLAAFTLWRYAVASVLDAVSGARPALAALETSEVPDHRNAAKWLAAGAAAFIWTPEEREVYLDASRTPWSEWTPELRDQARQLTDNHREAIGTMTRAISCDASSYGLRYRDGSSADLPDLLSLVTAQRLLVVEARIAADSDDPSRTLDALSTAATLAGSLERESFLVTALIGVAAERLMLWAIADVLSMHRPWIDDPEILGSIRTIVRSPRQDQDRSWARHERVVEALNRDFCHDDLRVMFLRTLETEIRAVELQAASALAEATFPTPDNIKGFRYIQRETRLKQHAASSIPDLLFVPYGASQEAFDLDIREPLGNEADYSEIWLRGFRNTVARVQLTSAQRQLVEAAIALRLIGYAEGEYPQDYPSGIDFQTEDPFTGHRLTYVLNDDGSATIALDDVERFMEKVVIARSARALPITLPPPR